MGLEVGVSRLRDAVCGWDSLEMRPRNLRPCGMPRALSSCRPGTPRCTPFLCVIRGQRGLKCESCSEWWWQYSEWDAASEFVTGYKLIGLFAPPSETVRHIWLPSETIRWMLLRGENSGFRLLTNRGRGGYRNWWKEGLGKRRDQQTVRCL